MFETNVFQRDIFKQMFKKHDDNRTFSCTSFQLKWGACHQEQEGYLGTSSE